MNKIFELVANSSFMHFVYSIFSHQKHQSYEQKLCTEIRVSEATILFYNLVIQLIYRIRF